MFGVRCFLVVSFLSSCVAVGQIFRLDQHAFPTVTVWYIPQDAQQLSPPVRIRDNGQNVALLEHTCIKQPSPRAIELVVCVDISSSNAAQVASRAIMDTIAATLATELSGYDCRFHVVAFNTAVTSYRNIQATELSSIFASLRFGGGTSYTAAFEEAAQILSTPSDRARWLLLITDGLDTVEIGSIRSLFGTSPPRVAALMLRNEAPECIRELARSTDGSWLELVSETGAASRSVAHLAKVITGQQLLCQLRYTARATCSASHDVQIEFPLASFGMRYHTDRTAAVELSTSHVYFGSPLVGTTRDATVTVTARNLPIHLDSVWVTGSPNFSMDAVADTILLPDQSVPLTVRYRTRDTSAAWGEVHLATSCGEHIVTFSVGRRTAQVVPSPFRVTAPRRGERYFSGSDVMVRWEGIPPDDSCRVSISSDGGASWQLLANDASGGRYRWKVPPLDQRIEARFRVERISSRPLERAESDPVTLEPTTGILAATDLGQASVGVRKDTVLRAFIRNPSSRLPLVIERIEFVGDHAADFGIASGVFPAIIPPAGTLDVELLFHPSSAGRRNAEVLLTTPGGYVRQLVWGHGVGTAPRHMLVDFGVVPVGDSRTEHIALDDTFSPAIAWSGDSSAFTFEPASTASERAIRFSPDSTRTYYAVAKLSGSQHSMTIQLRGQGIAPNRPAYPDPTAFRTVLQPTAEPLAAGSAGIGTYDGVGLLGVYAPTHTLAIFAGGMIPVTLSGTRSTAFGIGARGAFRLDTQWSVAIGGAIGQSTSNQASGETSILVAAPFAIATFATGPFRFNTGIGYAFKEHRTTEDRFRADVPITALGGDLLIAPQWKVALDVFGIGTVEHIPTLLTVRYFGERFSLDGGVLLAIPNVGAAHFAIFPVLNAFWMFR